MESLFGQVHAALSANGLLAYIPGGERANGKLAWVDRKGVAEFLEAPQRVYGVVDLSPDGKRLAVEVADVTDYIWIYDIERREGRRLFSSENNRAPAWAPDNIRIAHSSAPRDMPPGLVVRDVDGATAPTQVVKFSSDARWFPDGRALATHTYESGPNISFISIDGKIESTIVNKENSIGFVDPSPDGRWLAYSIEQSGRSEVWIRSYPDGKVSRQISTDGGIEPIWCPCNGKNELFYRKGNRWFSTKVTPTPEVHWDPPRLVFQTDFIDTPGYSYDISPDGQRLLVVKRAEPDVQNKIDVITNWYQTLDHKGQ
jgi:WD40 repeat protein